MHIIPPPFLLVQVKAPATLIIYALSRQYASVIILEPKVVDKLVVNRNQFGSQISQSQSQLSSMSNPSCSNLLRLSMSPPASITAFMAAWLSFLLLSAASFSRRALVLLLPLGATPVRILRLSSGVKLTKPDPPVDCCRDECREALLDFRRADAELEWLGR